MAEDRGKKINYINCPQTCQSWYHNDPEELPLPSDIVIKLVPALMRVQMAMLLPY